MADFAVWGEAIARAMGYKPMEFVNAYYDNIGKQNVEAIESNPLAQAIEKFVDSWYKEGKESLLAKFYFKSIRRPKQSSPEHTV